MVDDSTIDPITGLLHRAAFLQEVRDGQSKVPSHVRRGCLLILHFPIMKSIAEQRGSDAAVLALRNLLAVVETRLRSRDTLGRIADHSLCVLLRQCREKDAVIIAEQYVALLRDVIIDTGSQVAPMELRYRIVPLDSVGTRARQGVSRLVKESESHVGEGPTIGEKILAPATDPLPGKVVSINAAREKQSELQSLNHEEVAIETESQVIADAQSLREPSVTSTFDNWRLKPGLLLNNKSLVCCYRVQQVGIDRDFSELQSNPIFHNILNALALDGKAARPAVESQLIMPVHTSQLNSELPTWIKKRCTVKRVAPSDICLCLTINNLSKDLRATVPILRLLNRQGVRLMLEGLTSTSQFRALHNLAGFDYIYISAKLLQESLDQIRQRQELDTLITEAKVQHREICAAGIDSQILLAHARQLGVEIGFGRECGKSLPFPEIADSE